MGVSLEEIYRNIYTLAYEFMVYCFYRRDFHLNSKKRAQRVRSHDLDS